MPTSRRTAKLATRAAFLVALGLPVSAAEIDPRADEILRAMSTYMAGQTRFSLVADSSTEFLLTDGRKIQMTATSRALIDRERGMNVVRQGAVGDVRLVFDGTTVFLANEQNAIHLSIPATGGIDNALDEVRTVLGAEVVGGVDLLYANPYDGLMLGAESGEYLGQAWVGGVLTDHLSYRTPDIDWQLWVEADDTPAPVKYVITSKWMTGAPQFTVQVSEFVSPAEVVAADFLFVPLPGSREITVEELPDINFLAEE
jgi:hypothetical protein